MLEVQIIILFTDDLLSRQFFPIMTSNTGIYISTAGPNSDRKRDELHFFMSDSGKYSCHLSISHSDP